MNAHEIKQLREGDAVRWVVAGEELVEGRVDHCGRLALGISWADGSYSTFIFRRLDARIENLARAEKAVGAV